MSAQIIDAAVESSKKLKITEIFYSLQGESNTVGVPTVFVRLTGCPLRCQFCDTAYAFTGGEWMTVASIKATVANYKAQYVTVTGGEPLAQARCHALLTELCDANYKVSLETSGAIDVSQVDSRVVKVMDIKTPGSEEQDKNYWQNLEFLNAHDQIKFVIVDNADYQWAKEIINSKKLIEKCEVLLSPSYGQLAPDQLADWVLADKLPVRFQIQLHKYLWGDRPGH